MSTLGDLLAEHTVLPGSAVDHLHAVVGEWQLLADLSFADYLMWVRRDDDSLVCVAQCPAEHRAHGSAARRGRNRRLTPTGCRRSPRLSSRALSAWKALQANSFRGNRPE